MSNFYDNVLEVLQQEERFFSTEGNLLRNTVYDAAMQMDAGLLRLLLGNAGTKKAFFTDVEDTLVFDKVKFGWVINNRQFLPDSYTRFKNKIGLADENGDLLSASGKVELVFPYKDCILEGGQTKEDQKRSEIFYNETLAPDEIDRLLYPKVLVNAKRYTYDGDVDLIGNSIGVEGSVSCTPVTEFADTDNLIIKGNNLIVLSSLLKRYEGKVKCIYIDPPYNTRSAASTFSYNNTYNHSTWLTFMKNRLLIAKRFLANDGIFITSIDDNELFYLGALLDEIFGVENRLGVLAVVHNPGGRQDEEFFPTAHENMIVYAKDKQSVKLNNLPLSDKKRAEYSHEDHLGRYKLRGFRRSGNNSLRSQRPLLYYPIYINPLINTMSLDKHPNSIAVLPIDTDGVERCWRWGKDTFLQKKDSYLEIKEVNGKYDLYVRERESDYKGEKAKTIWDKPEYSGQNATSTLKKVLGKKAFSYPKSEFLMRDILTVCTNERDLILDFFIGSGTTAAVAHKMRRKYIGVEQMDYIDDVAIERLKKVIFGEQGGISQSVGWQGGGSFVYCELAKLNQSFVDEIQAAKDVGTIQDIYMRIMSTGFISCKVDPADIDIAAADFEALRFADQKRFLMELLDKNLLYINLCDMDDAEFAVNEVDKAFTKSFYKEV